MKRRGLFITTINVSRRLPLSYQRVLRSTSSSLMPRHISICSLREKHASQVAKRETASALFEFAVPETKRIEKNEAAEPGRVNYP